MNAKLQLLALILSIIAFVSCLTILLLGYYWGSDENNFLLLLLTGFSLALTSVNLANYRRSRQEGN